MARNLFSREDLAQMERMGVSPSEVERQLALFQKPDIYWELHRPCTVGDGIITVDERLERRCLEAYREGAEEGRFLKFVPASGAATRMFQHLFMVLNGELEGDLRVLERRSEQGDAAAGAVFRFVREARKFAFYDAWKEAVRRDGFQLDRWLQAGELKRSLEYLLTDRGLGLGTLPKALIPFHRYTDHVRTALEEHLVEATKHVRDAQGMCRVHFTVNPVREKAFRNHAEEARRRQEPLLDSTFSLSFSFQNPSTNTIAVDEHLRPFRDAEGRLVFRPAGHGALLENLNALRGDLVFIKNIDNVVPDHLRGETVRWKRILGGLAIFLQKRIHELLKRLRADGGREAVDEARRFLRETFQGEGKTPISAQETLSVQRDLLIEALDRPLRVCGMVRNVGEPGGGPFWVRHKDGEVRLQIVEKAQVNMKDPEQRAVWSRSTHFNPVDLVCAVRDPDGRPYDLMKFQDPEAVIVTSKSLEGRPLKALELPGLWNGSMAYWNTVFVEVPRITFNPVKTVLDLLKPEHQPPRS